MAGQRCPHVSAASPWASRGAASCLENGASCGTGIQVRIRGLSERGLVGSPVPGCLMPLRLRGHLGRRSAVASLAVAEFRHPGIGRTAGFRPGRIRPCLSRSESNAQSRRGGCGVARSRSFRRGRGHQPGDSGPHLPGRGPRTVSFPARRIRKPGQGAGNTPRDRAFGLPLLQRVLVVLAVALSRVRAWRLPGRASHGPGRRPGGCGTSYLRTRWCRAPGRRGRRDRRRQRDV